ncbi:conserved hypothetical protein; putative membrane protein [Bradyrhizobium sp. ORS 278]|uniref:hypothetical protein n=1 Tax=Bradyrhizobium sp. (strain ORS 278) TaxID=114615 RepID=UPI0001508AFD|nr:hypothetical protein [Bradyrhizobium sp. ORS 278]CAL79551.1 conserved hypothetical protein; putative membrane protein [Bradyrhizobium sp. ORS 278]
MYSTFDEGTERADETWLMDDGWLDLLRRCSSVVGGFGRAMVGAMSGTFVAAQLTMTSPAIFDHAEFIAGVVLSGTVAFYLATDVPSPPRAAGAMRLTRLVPQLARSLGEIGWFLAAFAALVSIYDFVFGTPVSPRWEVIIAGGWMFGVLMQSGSGLIARLR